MHRFEVHSYESACRKSERLVLETVCQSLRIIIDCNNQLNITLIKQKGNNLFFIIFNTYISIILNSVYVQFYQEYNFFVKYVFLVSVAKASSNIMSIFYYHNIMT